MSTKVSERIASIDILRGLDIFFLTCFGPIFGALISKADSPFWGAVRHQLNHVGWEGLTCWDMIMPLFLFTAGASMPFALSKYIGNSKMQVWKRIIKRVILLYLFGGVVQGNFLGLNFQYMHLFSNTLQSIAVGYLFSAIFILYLPGKYLPAVTALLFVSYWALMTFVGEGDYTPENNLAEKVDQVVLGPYRDGVSWSEDGNWHFAKWYHYTWILSSLNFIVTVMTGVLAGRVIRLQIDKIKRFRYLLLMAVGYLAAGYLMSLWIPIIKTIWNNPMTLITSGYSTLLLAVFYYLTDIKSGAKWLTWLKMWGMNSIVAYLLVEYLNFSCVTEKLIYGFEQYLGDYYNILFTSVNHLIPVVILYFLYKYKVFLRC